MDALISSLACFSLGVIAGWYAAHGVKGRSKRRRRGQRHGPAHVVKVLAAWVKSKHHTQQPASLRTTKAVRTMKAEEAFAALLGVDEDDPDWKPTVVHYSAEDYRRR